jgi:hypothetical protein
VKPKALNHSKNGSNLATLKVTIKAEKQPGNDSRERLKKE